MSDDERESLEGAERMMAEVPGAELSDEEADEMFGEVWEEAGGSDESADAGVVELDERRDTGSSEPASRERWPLAVAAAAMLALAGGWFAYRWSQSPAGESAYTGVKGPETALEVELIPLVGRFEEGEPQVGRRLESGGRLEAGERVLFRYRLDGRASVALLGQQQGGQVDILWRSESERSAPEAEIQANGRALALDASRYDGTFRLMVVAGGESAIERALDVSDLSRSALRQACPNCGVDIVQLEAP